MNNVAEVSQVYEIGSIEMGTEKSAAVISQNHSEEVKASQKNESCRNYWNWKLPWYRYMFSVCKLLTMTVYSL